MKLRLNHNSRSKVIWLCAALSIAFWMFAALSTSCFAESIEKTSRHGDVVFTVTASNNTVQVAEPLQLELKITAPEGTKVSFPVVGEQLGEWDVTGHNDSLDIPSQDQRVWVRRLTIETIQTGEIEIPAIEIRWIANGSDIGSAQSLASKPLVVRIASVLEDRADFTKFRDIRSVVDVPVPEKKDAASWTQIASLIGSVFACGALAYAFVAVRRRRPKITAREWAIHELETLTASDSFKSGESEVVLFTLANILRGYINFEFGVSAPMQTTEELLAQVAAVRSISDESSQRIHEVLMTADQTKFAGLELSKDRLANLVKQTREAILEPSLGKEAV
jgi:hypothetical protein